jgi:sulfate adenylyltransferase
MNRAHGGTLIDRTVSGAESEELKRLVRTLPRLTISAREANDLELIGNGALSPLTGFMRREQYGRVIEDMYLTDGIPWTIPVTLSVSEAELPLEGTSVALYDESDELRGMLDVEEVFSYDARR